MSQVVGCRDPSYGTAYCVGFISTWPGVHSVNEIR